MREAACNNIDFTNVTLEIQVELAKHKTALLEEIEVSALAAVGQSDQDSSIFSVNQTVYRF